MRNWTVPGFLRPHAVWWALAMLVAAVLLHAAGAQPAHAAGGNTCTSDRSGNWSATSTWANCDNDIPGPDDDVTLGGGHTVTLDVDASTTDLTIDDTATTSTLEVSGGFQLTLTGNWANNGQFEAGTSTVVFAGTSTQAITGETSFYNLTVDNSAASSSSERVSASSSSLTVENLLHVKDGVFESASDLHDVQIESGATLELTGDITVSGDWTNNGTLTHDGKKVTFDGTGDQSIGGSSTSTFAELVADKTAGKLTLSATSTATSASIKAADVVINAALTADGGITLEPSTATSTIGLGDSTSDFSIAETELQNLSSTSTVTIGRSDGSGPIDVGAFDVSGESYKLKIRAGSGTTTFTGTTTVGAAGLEVDPPDTVVVNAPISSTGGGPMVLKANDGVTIDADIRAGGQLTIDSDANDSVDTNDDIQIDAVTIQAGATTTLSVGTDKSIEFTGVDNSTATIDVNGGSHLVLPKLTDTNNPNIEIKSDGEIELSDGVVLGTGNHTFTADEDGGNAVAIILSGGDFRSTTGTQKFVGGLTLSGTSTFACSTCDADVDGPFTIRSGASSTAPGATGILRVSGNWTNEGTFNAKGGEVELDGGSGTQVVSGTTTFFNLTLTNTNVTRDFGSSRVTVENEYTAKSGTIDASTSTFIFTGANGKMSGDGLKKFHDVIIASGASISVVDDGSSEAGNVEVFDSFTNDGTLNQSSTISFIFENEDGTISVSGSGTSTFGGFDINLATEVDASSHDFTVTGDTFDVPGDGKFDMNAGTVTFSNSATTSISGAGPKNFHSVTVAASASSTLVDVTGSGAVSVADLLRIEKGIFRSASDFHDVQIDSAGTLELTDDITVSGDFTNSGTFTHNDHKVTFDGTGMQNLAANVATAFAELELSGTTSHVLLETEEADNVTAATTTNSGTIRKTISSLGSATTTFGLTGIKIHQPSATVTALTVDRIDSNHPNAPNSASSTGLRTSKYWSLSATGTDFTVDVTFPVPESSTSTHAGFEHSRAQACRYDGSGSSNPSKWDCGRTSSTSTDSIPGTTGTGPTVTRTVSELSDWTVGDPEADLEVSKADDPDPVVVNQTLTYEPFTIVNNGPFPATDVVLTDSLPSSVTGATSSFVVLDPDGNEVGSGACSISGNTVTCEIDEIPAGGEVQITLEVNAPGDASVDLITDSIVNSASTTALEFDPEASNNDTSAGTTVIGQDPGTRAMTFSATWQTGTLRLDADADGSTSTGADVLNYALTDTNSDGVYDQMDLSIEDDTFNEGATSSQKVDIGSAGDDETVATTTAVDLQLGPHYTFTVSFSPTPAATSTTEDVSITSKTWFTNSFTIDADADGDADDSANFALVDTDSDALYGTMDLSINDTTFGQGVGSIPDTSATATGTDDARFTGTDVTLGAYIFDVDFDNNPGLSATDTDATITSTTWFTGDFEVDTDADGNESETTDSDTADDVRFAMSDSDSNGQYDTVDLSTDDGDFGDTSGFDGVNGNADDGALSGQSPRRTGSGDDERLGPGTGGGNSGSSTDVRLGEFYAFTVDFDNNPATTADADDIRITALTHFEGAFEFDADEDFQIDPSPKDRLFYGLTDTDSDGLYDTIDFALDDRDFDDGTLDNGEVDSPNLGGNDDERIEFLASDATRDPGSNTLIAEDSFTLAPNDKNAEIFAAWAINPGNGDIAQDEPDINGDGTSDLDSASATTSRAAILHEVAGSTVIRFTALDSWRIDADGDEQADDDVFFVLSMTGSTGLVDTIDISIGDKVFGKYSGSTPPGTGTLSDGRVDFGQTSNTNDERFSRGDTGVTCDSVTCSRVVTLGEHPFTVAFDNILDGTGDSADDLNDARITAPWYTGSIPVDVDNDRRDNTIDYSLVDPNSDGLFTVAEVDGDDSGGFDASEVHESAGEKWFRPVVADAGEDNDDVGRHSALDTIGEEKAFIAYYDADDEDLLFTKTDNAGLDWTKPVTIDSAGDVGKYNSLVAIDADTLVVSYYDATNGDLKAAKSADGGGTWSVSTVDAGSGGDVGRFTSISAGTSSEVYLSYYEATSGSEGLKVARSSDGGATWSSTTTVDSTGDVGQYSSVSALEDGETAYVSYYDATNGALKVVRTTSGGETAGEWETPVTVDGSSTSTDVGKFSSVVALRDATSQLTSDPGDTVFVSYYDADNKNLKVAGTRTSGTSASSWDTVTVDSDGDVGQHSSIAAAEENTVFVAYYDATEDEEALKVARTTDGGGTPAAWFKTTVDGANGADVGRFASISNFRTHEVFVSYYDASEHDLKFAKSRLLVDLEGHRMSLQYAMNASDVTLTNGRILQVAQLGPDEWLFEIPRDADLGPNIEQSQIRVVVQVPDNAAPGFSEIRLDVVQRE